MLPWTTLKSVVLVAEVEVSWWTQFQIAQLNIPNEARKLALEHKFPNDILVASKYVLILETD